MSDPGLRQIETSLASPQTTAAAVAKQIPATRDINQIAQQVADRILVSSPNAKTNPEVRIQLNDSYLQGSDVRVFREGGELRIVFVAQSADTANYIAQNRDSMQQALSSRLPGEQVAVSIETTNPRQSGEENQGRSRQRYEAEDYDSDRDAG